MRKGVPSVIAHHLDSGSCNGTGVNGCARRFDIQARAGKKDPDPEEGPEEGEEDDEDSEDDEDAEEDDEEEGFPGKSELN